MNKLKHKVSKYIIIDMLLIFNFICKYGHDSFYYCITGSKKVIFA